MSSTGVAFMSAPPLAPASAALAEPPPAAFPVLGRTPSCGPTTDCWTCMGAARLGPLAAGTCCDAGGTLFSVGAGLSAESNLAFWGSGCPSAAGAHLPSASTSLACDAGGLRACRACAQSWPALPGTAPCADSAPATVLAAGLVALAAPEGGSTSAAAAVYGTGGAPKRVECRPGRGCGVRLRPYALAIELRCPARPASVAADDTGCANACGRTGPALVAPTGVAGWTEGVACAAVIAGGKGSLRSRSTEDAAVSSVWCGASSACRVAAAACARGERECRGGTAPTDVRRGPTCSGASAEMVADVAGAAKAAEERGCGGGGRYADSPAHMDGIITDCSCLD